MEAFLAEWNAEHPNAPICHSERSEESRCSDATTEILRAAQDDKAGSRGPRSAKLHPNYEKKFTEVLARVDAHPNRRYFVLKSIILNNLYAVDIMEEVVEICKLRLFLKLAAQVEPDAGKDNLGIEPLPDIDFNIRAGNSLVGYATYDEVKKAVTSSLDFDNAMEKISVKAADLQQTFDKFRQLQTEGDGSVPAADKLELQKRLKALEDELNRHLAGEYGVNVKDKAAFAAWVKSHQPFHWFIEFYGIITSGGFDVIIGNPPYVEYSKIAREYAIRGYVTQDCGNLYAYVVERSLQLLTDEGAFGMIVPLSLVSTERMSALQSILTQGKRIVWLSLYDVYPSKVFEGAKQRLTIALMSGCRNQPGMYSTKYNRWKPEERDSLVQNLRYRPTWYDKQLSVMPKTGCHITESVLRKLERHAPAPHVEPAGQPSFYVHRIPYNYAKAIDFVPYFWNAVDGQKKSEDYKPYRLSDRRDARAVLAVLNSNLFFWWWYALFEGYHCGKHEIFAFPIGLKSMSEKTRSLLTELADRLMKDVTSHKKPKTCEYEHTGKVVYDEFYPDLSKPAIDEIDVVLAGHYGLTAEELDFIPSGDSGQALNYDIKYRLGRDAGEEDAE